MNETILWWNRQCVSFMVVRLYLSVDSSTGRLRKIIFLGKQIRSFDESPFPVVWHLNLLDFLIWRDHKVSFWVDRPSKGFEDVRSKRSLKTLLRFGFNPYLGYKVMSLGCFMCSIQRYIDHCFFVGPGGVYQDIRSTTTLDREVFRYMETPTYIGPFNWKRLNMFPTT